ncbi:MAG: hypothetical protein RLZZ612_1040, partial [Pseudomonadota bacterium]
FESSGLRQNRASSSVSVFLFHHPWYAHPQVEFSGLNVNRPQSLIVGLEGCVVDNAALQHH